MKMSAKGKMNYWVDVVIGLAFVFSALSGLVLFFAPSGYQGGRNPYYGQTVLFLSTQAWDTIHTWSSIAMISGVGAHLILHWNWMVCMTRKLFAVRRPLRREPAACPVE
jgi:hypothetical protein